ncbi:MAG: DNA repair protein RecO [Bacteroidota bacterium]|nr:DNA repair protein RecO [Bacteroidota bacterium]
MASEKSRGIIINHVNYSETSVVCNIFTREHGLLGFMMKGLRRGKGAIKSSHIMSLNLVDIIFDKKPSQQLLTLKELHCNPLLMGIHGEINKNALSIFISEVLQKNLYKEHIDQSLFDYLESSIIYINRTKNIANLPCYFLIKLAVFMGFKPKGAWQPDELLMLDIFDGIFTNLVKKDHPQLSVNASRYIYNLLNSTIEQQEDLTESYQTRIEALDGLVDYFQFHILNQRKLISHQILHDILR